MNKPTSLKDQLRIVIFGTNTKAGKLFDIVLLWTILASVVVVVLESIPEIHQNHFRFFYTIEWVFTILFTIEYVLRVWCVLKPLRYVTGIWGIIDLLSILPTYIGLFISGYHYLMVVRIFRLLRIFRIMKLVRYNKEAQLLLQSLRAGSYKISIFLLFVFIMVTILGSVMYVVEGGDGGFTSIPQSIYWAIVTLTTVGFGDIVPQTILGKFISSIVMVLGYAIIAVPTGIVTVELVKSKNDDNACPNCSFINPNNATYCSQCGEHLDVYAGKENDGK